MQEVARAQISSIRDQVACAAFEMVAPKRTDITSWIAESWKELSSKTIVSGFAKAGLLGDVRSGEADGESSSVETITDFFDQLSELGVTGRSVTTDDESESGSDDEL
ncbi:hypothetical protein PF005_g4802 [Phytophthora fragariae]|uniref:DDE-1 domain-containing protein n=1 Tax=Phytophthora fragariae TaxID=53985 RepID=A0A6A3STC3_9STRA|nr:hypothetical protein PF003_g2323 [Phytophthora fragariae]KAE8945216.1 hypothetical protein PF009_g5123 [Phytophthora fragariae]KAE9023753.1 hypothetical protein PF011_g3845 [Phytophthora fragariae]KAE9123668.1 hypothetical protein PF007_g6979 [Phytophthora fragariae]KAE9151708.1 hypothetical protein PF006_g4032 [Phytophthora fragariae]